MDKIMITGGTGFIGRHIVEYFSAQGEDIHAVTRSEADIKDYDSLVAAFAGADCVIHNAALAKDWGNCQDFYNTNVIGTRNVIKACRQQGIKRLILTGSCSVYGEENCRVKKDEESPLNSHYHYFLDRIFPCAMNYYRDTKRMAVEMALQATGMDITILHPVWVYGEGEFHTGFYEYLKTVQSKLPFIMGSKRNEFHVIYAGDLAKAYYLAYRAKLPGIRSFIIGNEKTARMDQIYTLFCAAAGLKKPANAPKWLFYPLGFFMELWHTVFRIKTVPLLTRGRVNMFYDSIAYDTKKAYQELGFTCDFGLKKGIKQTVKWYQENGYL